MRHSLEASVAMVRPRPSWTATRGLDAANLLRRGPIKASEASNQRSLSSATSVRPPALRSLGPVRAEIAPESLGGGRRIPPRLGVEYRGGHERRIAKLTTASQPRGSRGIGCHPESPGTSLVELRC